MVAETARYRYHFAMFERQRVLTAVLLTVAMRALVPAGYMPGSVAAGEWMVLCPANSWASYALLDAIAPDANGAGKHSHHAHHGHHGHHGAANEASAAAPDSCPLGNALSQAAAADQQGSADSGLPQSATVPPWPAAAPRVRLIDRHYPVRGPPRAV